METKIIYQPTPCVKFHDEWFDARNVIDGLYQFLGESPEGSSIWDALRDYEIELDSKLLKMLVNDGIIHHEIGERASKRYWIADGKTDTIKDMINELRNFVAVYHNNIKTNQLKQLEKGSI